MKTWTQALSDSALPGVLATVTTLAMIAARGRQETGSAIAPINASSHALWGKRAADIEEITLRHTLPGLLANVAGAFWWALVFEKLFGATLSGRSITRAAAGSAATAGLAYAIDYGMLPRQLTPGWEHRIADRGLFLGLGAMAAGICAGAMLVRRDGRSP